MGGWGFCFFYLCHKSVPGILTFGIKVGCTAMSWSAPNYYMSRGQECQAPVTNVAPACKEMSRGLLLPWLQHPSKSGSQLRVHVSTRR